MIALYSVLSILGLLVVLELSARFAILRGPYRVWPPHRKESMTLDSEANPTLPAEVRFTINALGERSLTTPSKRSFNILATGGSAVECYMLDDKSAWTNVLGELVQEPRYYKITEGRKVHVGSIGRAGVDSKSLEQILNHVLPTSYRIDLLIVMVGASDVLRWLETGANQERAATPLAISESFAWHPEHTFSLHPKRWGLAEIYRRFRSMFPPHRTGALKWYSKARMMRKNAPVTHTEAPPHPLVQMQFEESMRTLLERAKTHATQVLVVPQPWYFKDRYQPEDETLFWNGGVGKPHRDEIKEYYSSGVISDLMQEILVRTESTAAALNVPLLNLLPILEPSTANFIDQFHFTPDASHKVAQAIADKLLSLKN